MFANIGPWQLLIILLIVLAIFGTKKLSTLGSDLGKSVKGFRKAMSDTEDVAEKLSDTKDAEFNEAPAEEKASDKKKT
jgi:sec-independent protein translocase protein TatA